ncbi:hypothetical protein Pelo_7088 [Pelomyxa schiedti]|nr:hypothetical protein Pelo_7088 [Pelomyxa schiedti]
MSHNDIRIDKQELLLRGWLWKEGAIYTNWRKRWFRNTKENLYVLEYYSDSSCDHAYFKGLIDLTQVVDWRGSHGKSLGDKMTTGILLSTPSRNWRLVARGATSSDYWMWGLAHLMRRMKSEGSHHPTDFRVSQYSAVPIITTTPTSTAQHDSPSSVTPKPTKKPSSAHYDDDNDSGFGLGDYEETTERQTTSSSNRTGSSQQQQSQQVDYDSIFRVIPSASNNKGSTSSASHNPHAPATNPGQQKQARPDRNSYEEWGDDDF